MKATKQVFPAVLFILLYKLILTFELVEEKHWEVLWHGAVSCSLTFASKRT